MYNVEDNNKIKLNEDNKIETFKEQYIPSEQSANALFKFIDQIEYLKDLIKKKAIIPRYYEETIEYLNLEKYKKIAFPMSCFCDIHLNKLLSHMNFYGYFGIGLDKKWGIEKGIQPVHYINNNSSLISDYKLIFKKSLEMKEEERMAIKDYNNYLLTNLLFLKPLCGKMLRNGEYRDKNFHDEREWRYVPNINKSDTELPLLIPAIYMNPKAYLSYSEGIRQCTDLWLKFEYENIKYLIVEKNKDRINLIEFIDKEIKAESKDKLSLISKILVFDELREDW